MDKKNSKYRLPSVDKVINDIDVREATADLPRPAVVNAIRAVLDGFRHDISEGRREPKGMITIEELVPLISAKAREDLAPTVRDVINATGVVIHTNLGRAPLSPSAAEAAVSMGTRYSDLEYDLKSARRGSRTKSVESLISALTGAPAALVVNNNAAALLLILSTMAKDKEVIVSRGELIEIGDSFRLPEIMIAGGCLLREVGTTNRTNLGDYERVINDKTALILKVHTSNYKVLGFTASVALDKLVALGRGHRLPVVEDLGSGNLITIPGLEEPTVSTSVKAGADLITFSGDKMLGGPQCGFIIGDAKLVKALRMSPVYRALRLDKMTLAALEITLKLYINDNPMEKIPVLAMLSQTIDVLKKRAASLEALLQGLENVVIEAGETSAKVGGGALPGRELRSWAVKLRPTGMSEDQFMTSLRAGEPPIIARIDGGAVVLDMMTIPDSEIKALAAAVKSAASRSG